VHQDRGGCHALEGGGGGGGGGGSSSAGGSGEEGRGDVEFVLRYSRDKGGARQLGEIPLHLLFYQLIKLIRRLISRGKCCSWCEAAGGDPAAGVSGECFQ